MNKFLKNRLNAIARGEELLPILKKFLEETNKNGRGSPDTVKKDAQMTIDCFSERLAKYSSEEKDFKGYVHPSQLGRCAREMFFSKHGALTNGPVPSEELLRTHITFEFGTYAHVLFQNLCELAGVLEKREVLVLSRLQKIVGHADGLLKLPSGKSILELKTSNARNFGLLANAPKDAHKRQAHVYMFVLGVKRTTFVYLNKDTSEAKEFSVSFDATYYKQEVAPRINAIRSALNFTKLPEREGANAHSPPCNYCPFSMLCFNRHELNGWLKKKKFQPALNDDKTF